MAFRVGEVGNPRGRPPAEKSFRAALDKALASDDGKRLRATADKLLDLASNGEPWAVQMLADRLDGKATQQVEMNVHRDVKDLSESELVERLASLEGALRSATGDQASAAVTTGLH